MSASLEKGVTAETVDGVPVVAGDCQVIVPPGPGVVNVFSSAPEAVIQVSPPDSNLTMSGSSAFVCEYPPDPTSVVLTATPAEGYFFNGWSVDGGPVIWEETISVYVETDMERTAEVVYSPLGSRRSCGLGAELVLLGVPLLWLRRRRK